jgi:ABC-type multidrug transport system ATPase subunit
MPEADPVACSHHQPSSSCSAVTPTSSLSGHADIFGFDCQRRAVEAQHRRLAYVPGEANLSPSLTGAEVLHPLGQVSIPK